MNERCVVCRFYLPHFENQGPIEREQPLSEGSCRRYPPSIPEMAMVNVVRGFTFPVVGAGEWCGEFDRKREERDDED